MGDRYRRSVVFMEGPGFSPDMRHSLFSSVRPRKLRHMSHNCSLSHPSCSVINKPTLKTYTFETESLHKPVSLSQTIGSKSENGFGPHLE